MAATVLKSMLESAALKFGLNSKKSTQNKGAFLLLARGGVARRVRAKRDRCRAVPPTLARERLHRRHSLPSKLARRRRRKALRYTASFCIFGDNVYPALVLDLTLNVGYVNIRSALNALNYSLGNKRFTGVVVA